MWGTSAAMKIALQLIVLAGAMLIGATASRAGRANDVRCQVGPLNAAFPAGNSAACLACHDGTMARNAFPGRAPGAGDSQGGNHPVLVSYEQAYRRNPAALVAATALDPKLQLVDGKVQCVTCHQLTPAQRWVVVSLPGQRDLCLGCHRK